MRSSTTMPDNAKKIMTSEREVIEKLEKIGAGAFDLLKEHVEEKHEALNAAMKAYDSIESNSEYYATPFLRKQFLENCRATLQQPNVEKPLAFIQEALQKKHDAVLQDIRIHYEVIKESVETNLQEEKKHERNIQQLEPRLKKVSDSFANGLVVKLQHVAEECWQHPITKVAWANKYNEFIDIFGCVVNLVGSQQPYRLDKLAGYGINFGHEVRIAGKLSGSLTSIESIKRMTLTDIENMINHVINECHFYSNSDFLKIIKKHFEDLASGSYHGFLKFEEGGIFYRRIIESIYVVKEANIVEKPLATARSEYHDSEKVNDREVTEYMREMLTLLEHSFEAYRQDVNKSLELIEAEVKNASENLSHLSEKMYKDIDSSIASMKSNTSEAQSILTSLDASIYKVKLAYDGAMRYAKAMNQNEFVRFSKSAEDSLADATKQMAEINECLLMLEKQSRNIATKLITAKEMFDGSAYQILQKTYIRLKKNLEEIKNSHLHTENDFKHATILPRAIHDYGDFNFDCARIKSIIDDLPKQLTDIPVIIKSLNQKFSTRLDEAKEGKEIKVADEHVCSEVKAANDILLDIATKLKMVAEQKEILKQKLNKAQAEGFAPEIHAAHAETFSQLEMAFANAQEKYEVEQKNLATINAIPGAMEEYSAIVADIASMQNDLLLIMQAAKNTAAYFSDINSANEQAERLASMGVGKKELMLMANARLAEMKMDVESATRILDLAQKNLLRVEQVLTAAKDKYPEELHEKSHQLFSAAKDDYALALKSYQVATEQYAEASRKIDVLETQSKHAKQLEDEKKLATETRQLLLDAILNNLRLWKPWVGGMDYQYNGVSYRIPHGVHDLIVALTKTTDHNRWINQVASISRERYSIANTWKSGAWMYRLFHVRNEETTGTLYRAIKNLTFDENSIQSMRAALERIPGMHLVNLAQPQL